MKITNITKSLTYYIETDDPDFPDYRTNENGEEWENYLGGIWQPIFGHQTKELQKLFWEYKDQMNDEEELWIR
jgi:hypothetical protein